MITKEEVFLIHNEVVKVHGGANGIRDIIGLESAVARPYATYDGIELYPTAIEKAAAIGQSIVINHPFVDGNKRTGYVLMETILRLENVMISANDDDLYTFVIKISTGELNTDEIVEWLKNNTKPF